MTTISREEKQKAALALNLCTVSVSQIIEYQDVNILQQEYDSILNNINLQQIIKDESLLKSITVILDTVTFYMIQDTERKLVEEEYQAQIRNAIWNSIPHGAVILSGNPIAIGVAAAGVMGVGFMNYRTNLAKAKDQQKKERWKLQKSAIEQLNGLRRSLFETAWRLSEAYDFPDEWRLTEKQITKYNIILMDPDCHRRYDRLDSLSHIFEAYPHFWYYKSRAALESSRLYATLDDHQTSEHFKSLSQSSLDKFQEVYCPIMREDIIAASAAIDRISLLNPEKDKDEILNLLSMAEKFGTSNNDLLQLCALNYLTIGNAEKAISILRKLVNDGYNKNLNGKLLSRIYTEQKNEIEYKILVHRVGERNVLPWANTIEEAEALGLSEYRQYIKKRRDNLLFRYFKLKNAKAVAVPQKQLLDWEQSLGKNISWKKKVENADIFSDWKYQIECAINANINGILQDKSFENALALDLSWAAEVEKIAVKNSERMLAFNEKINAFMFLGTKIKEDTGMLSGVGEAPESNKALQGATSFLKKNTFIAKAFSQADDSIISQYVTAGKRLRNELEALSNDFVVFAMKFMTMVTEEKIVRVKDETEITKINFAYDFLESKVVEEEERLERGENSRLIAPEKFENFFVNIQ